MIHLRMRTAAQAIAAAKAAGTTIRRVHVHFAAMSGTPQLSMMKSPISGRYV
jgi:hypothetical protein